MEFFTQPSNPRKTDMNQDEIDGLIGTVTAISMTLSVIIRTLPATNCAYAAQLLKKEEDAQTDEDRDTPPVEARARGSAVDAYVDLLSTIAKNG